MEDREALNWISENAIIDVPDYLQVPLTVRAWMGHIHSQGICMKNRYGPFCGVDNGN